MILDIETYNTLVSDDYHYDEPYVVTLDKKAQAEHKAGKTKKLSSLADFLKITPTHQNHCHNERAGFYLIALFCLFPSSIIQFTDNGNQDTMHP